MIQSTQILNWGLLDLLISKVLSTVIQACRSFVLKAPSWVKEQIQSVHVWTETSSRRHDAYVFMETECMTVFKRLLKHFKYNLNANLFWLLC